MKNLYFIIFLLFISLPLSAQITVRGTISDENGETLIGATVVLKSNRGIGTVTDFDGKYTLKISESTSETLIVSFVGYTSFEFSVSGNPNDVIIKDISLKSASQLLGEVEIQAKAARANNSYMEKMKINSATSIDFISSQTISQTGDGNVVAAVSRITGVSKVGDFLTVRGINDRYIKTTINGLSIPTLDPFTNNLKLDIFPTSIVDNIMITKTNSPELAGDWAGAYMAVYTKDYPDYLDIKVETSFGFNAQSTFKPYISSQKSTSDWIGTDNGYREYDHESFSNAIIDPGTYEKMVAIGLGAYYNSIGVNSNWLPGSSIGDVYFKLGLVQLGLLPPALFNDPDAFAVARLAFETGPYKDQAFLSINKNAAKSGQAFPNNWSLIKRNAPLDFSQSISIGNQVDFLKKPLGFMLAFRYGSTVVYDSQSIANRAGVNANGEDFLASSSSQKVSKESNGWNALASFAYKLNANNSLGFLFLPNVMGVNNVRDAIDEGTNQTYIYTFNKEQFYESRKQMIYQLKSENYIPAFKLKSHLNLSFTNGKSKAPDFRTLQFFANEDLQWLIDTKESDTHRYFRYLDEQMFDSKWDIELPLDDFPGLVRLIRFGSSFQYKNRNYQQYDYQLIYNSAELEIQNNDLDHFFSLDHFGISTAISDTNSYLTLDKYYLEADLPSNKTIGSSMISGGYIMADYNLNSLWRISGGIRTEYAHIYTDVFEYDQKGYGVNDPRRQYPGDAFLVNPSVIYELNILPSMNVIYKLKIGENNPSNIRFNFSQSVARPSMREITESFVYDFELEEYVFGRSDLKTVRINNFDFRYENYYKSGDNFQVSLFYKKFKNHIELVKTFQGYTWQNVDNSFVYGFEAEGRKKILRGFDVGINFTYVQSKTEFIQYRLQIDNGIKNYIPFDTISRTMFGQSPFIINGILNYSNDSLGLEVTLSYNLQGEKLVLTTTDGTPDIFEMPRHLIDLKISKKINKHFSTSLKVRNILNESTRRSYIYNDNREVIYDRYTYGTSFILGISYKL